MNAERPILLTGYDAKRCARRIHNEWDPTIEKVAWEVPADLQVRFDAGIVFEATVFADLKASMDEVQYVDLAAIRGKQAVVAGTLEAMDRDVALTSAVGYPTTKMAVGPGGQTCWSTWVTAATCLATSKHTGRSHAGPKER